MPSWQARLAAGYVRLVVRRVDWGDTDALARRSRRLFGPPSWYQRLTMHDVRATPVHTDTVRGEWIDPESPTGNAVLLYVHGGGYVSCSARAYRPLTAALARRLGWRVFSTDYRTAPESRFPAAFDDVVAAYRWLQTDGAPGARIAIAGDSAGGGLVLALAMHIRDVGWPPPTCVAALSPWTDLAATGDSLQRNNGQCAMFRPENMPAFASAYLGNASAMDPRASPLYGDVHNLPPVLLQVGSTELLLDDAQRVHDRIASAGGSSRITIYDDVMHGWHLMEAIVPESKAAVDEIVTFIHEHHTLTVEMGTGMRT
jgi:epsilon-lactone hydrolase